MGHKSLFDLFDLCRVYRHAKAICVFTIVGPAAPKRNCGKWRIGEIEPRLDCVALRLFKGHLALQKLRCTTADLGGIASGQKHVLCPSPDHFGATF